MSKYAVLLAEQIIKISGMEESLSGKEPQAGKELGTEETCRAEKILQALEEAVSVNRRWQNGEAKFQEARQVAGILNSLARDERDRVTV